MKTLNKICWILSIVFGVGSLVLFFTDFAVLTVGKESVKAVAAELAFGSELEVGGKAVDIAKSANILFCFIITAIAAVLSIIGFKSKKIRYATPAVSGFAGIYMLVVALSGPHAFVDHRPLNLTKLEYTPFVWILAGALIVSALISLAYLLIDDRIEVMASKGEKLSIPKRIVRFFRDYKSEIKKIVWPGWKDVAKNTLIVIAICVIIGLFVWVVDFGLAKAIELILGTGVE